MRLIFLLFLLLPLHNSWAFDLFGRNAAQADEAKPPESGPHSKDSKEEYLKDAATKEGVKVVANDRWRKEQKKLKRNRDRQRQQKRRDAKLAWGETDELRKSLVTVDESILGGDAATAAKNGVDAISAKVQSRMEEIFEDAKTPGCRKIIAEAFSEYIGAIGGETSLPYADHNFATECPRRAAHRNDNEHSSANSTNVKLDDPTELKILYLIMTHEKPKQTIRLISVLEDLGHTFVIHVDAKPGSDETQEVLKGHYADHPLVHVLPDDFRIGVNWGGYTVVESTLKAIEYAFGIGRPGVPFDFHRVINIASTSYPLKSNKEIREKLNSHPLDVNFVEVRPSPNRPNPKNWHKFVECDDKVHRIYRMNIPKTIPMFVGSQWFVITREFAEYMVDGSSEFVTDYKAYCKHVVVADENFFATVLKNSPFCDKHANDNLLHMQFDDWENNRKKKEELDPSKCLMPDPEHCGRSPTTMTYDYLPVLELSDGLFARKFSVDVDAEILDIIDRKRLSEDSAPKKLFPDGENVIFVKKDTIDGGSAMCLSRSANGKEVMYAECFEKGASKLEDNWEKKLIPSSVQVPTLSKWSVGPCSTDGSLSFNAGSCLETGEGVISKIGPTCKIMGATNTKHQDLCLDVEGENMVPGGNFLMYGCTGRWNQYFSFGGANTLDCSVHLNVPSHLIESKTRTGKKKQVKHLCINAGNEKNKKIRTANCVPEDDSGIEMEEWMERGNEWLVVRFENAGMVDSQGWDSAEL